MVCWSPAGINGLGVLVTPTFIAHSAIETAQLEPILQSFHTPVQNLYAVYPTGRQHSHKVRVFVDYLRQCFGERPYWERCLQSKHWQDTR